MPKKSKPEVAVAVVTIRDAARMTPEGRKAVADWLRSRAKDLVKEGPNYAQRFTGRYFGVR